MYFCMTFTYFKPLKLVGLIKYSYPHLCCCNALYHRKGLAIKAAKNLV